jgi:hypothetical protein
VGKHSIYSLPSTKDYDGDTVTTSISLYNSKKSLPYYISAIDGVVSFYPLYSTDIGTVTINVTLTDNNYYPSTLSKSYSFTVTVKAVVNTTTSDTNYKAKIIPPGSQVVKSTSSSSSSSHTNSIVIDKTLDMKITNIDTSGLVSISFSKELVVPTSFPNTTLGLSMSRDETSVTELLEYFNIVSFSAYKMEL